MSLINQMLRDLERRNDPTLGRTGPVNATTAPSRPRLGRLGWLALIAVPSAYVWYHYPAPMQSTQAASPSNGPASQGRGTALPTSPASPQDTPSPPIPLAPKAAAGPAIAEAAEKPSKPVEKPREKSPRRQAPKAAKPANAPAPGERAEEYYRQAQRNMSLLMARENLREALALDPSYLPARALLLQILLKSHAPDAEIAAFADESLKFFPSNPLFLKTRAHGHIQQKNFNAAVDLLERIDADTLDDNAYLALLAAGYQQLRRFPEATRIYRRLTQIQPDKAENWLGLAMAQDKLNQSQTAIQAYKHALDKKTLNPEVVNYINQRLDDLTR